MTTDAKDALPWKPIPGWEGFYEASPNGMIRGLRHRWGLKEPRIRRPFKSKDGYLKVNLTRNNKPRAYGVHRLIAMTFICLPPFPGAEVNHKDGVRDNNDVSNLEWVNDYEQQRHSSKRGAAALIKYPQETVDRSRSLYASGLTITMISALMGICEQTIHRWVTGEIRGYGENKNISRGRSAASGNWSSSRRWHSEHRKV